MLAKLRATLVEIGISDAAGSNTPFRSSQKPVTPSGTTVARRYSKAARRSRPSVPREIHSQPLDDAKSIVNTILSHIQRSLADIQQLVKLQPFAAVGRKALLEDQEPRFLDLLPFEDKSNPQARLRNIFSQLSYAKSYEELQCDSEVVMTKFVSQFKLEANLEKRLYKAVRTGRKLGHIDRDCRQLIMSQEERLSQSSQLDSPGKYSASSLFSLLPIAIQVVWRKLIADGWLKLFTIHHGKRHSTLTANGSQIVSISTTVRWQCMEHNIR